MSCHKIAVLGNGGVGKSSIVLQFCNSKFLPDYDPTIEDNFRHPCVVDSKACVLDILDTAGQEEFRALREQWISAAEGIIIIYSVDNRDSFEEVDVIVKHILRSKEAEDTSSVPIVLAANKCDLPDDERAINSELCTEQGKRHCVPVFETSAKERVNIDQVFYALVRRIREPTGTVFVEEETPHRRCVLH